MAKKSLPPTTLVIFGVTGDLSSRYLLPALSEIKKSSQLPGSFKVLGVTRRDIAIDQVLDDKTANLAENLEIFKMDLANPSDYARLKQRLDKESANGQVLLHLSVPPVAVMGIVEHIGSAGLNQQNTKLLLEKPFGVDLASAENLAEHIAKYFKDEQVYRIDHYLAKEMSQNIVVFLSSNALFSGVWDNKSIESIEVIATEEIGIEGRAAFYEPTGALRDFVQSHLMQLAALTLMKPCSQLFEFSELPERRLAALNDLRLDDINSVVRGQYDGYRQEASNSRSNTETFVNLKLKSSNPRWTGVPITLTTGKSLDQRLTEIRVEFKRSDSGQANTLVMRIQPKEGIEIDVWAKLPGYERKLEKQLLSYEYEQSSRSPDAYEQILVDAMRSDQSLFASADEVLASWKILQPVLDHWNMSSQEPKLYKPGSSIDQVLS